jgi:hypothetical protein
MPGNEFQGVYAIGREWRYRQKRSEKLASRGALVG